MNTRLLETRDLFRATVKSAELLEHGMSHLTLRTTAVLASRSAVSSADPHMVHQRQLAAVGQPVPGLARVDVISPTAVRVRYAEGAQVPERSTSMVVGWPVPPECAFEPDVRMDLGAEMAPWLDRHEQPGVEEKGVALATAATCVRVCLDPFCLEVLDARGVRVVGIGGPEKDNLNNWDSYNTGVCRSLRDGSPVAVESFDLRPHEAVYGLGEKFLRLNKVGQTVDLDMTDALGVTTPRSYKNIPFFVSTAGYGVFFHHSSRMTYWVGSLSAADVQVAAEDDFLDYVVFLGTIPEVLAQYTELTGKGVVPPRWTFGYWQSKISYTSAAETLDIARKMREHQVPCDVIHLDTHWFKADWYCDLELDEERFPNPKEYFDELARLGIKISLWQLPYIPEGSALFDALAKVDGFVKNEQGDIYDTRLCFTPGFKGIVGCVDYTNPAAVAVHQEALRKLFRLGAKVIKTDFGEAAPLDGVYHDGTPGHRMHNLYPLLYNQAVFEVTKEATGDGVVWARSAWAGSQRYPLHWGGDSSPNWANMVPQLEGGLSFGLSGFQFWSQDIGGFCGTISDVLLIRWMQLGMFLSHSRIHGFGDRELYKFHPEVLRICRDFIRLRYRLMPYIHGAAQACVARSLPMARALVVEYQDDPTVWNLGDEYLFGDSLLVAPIVDATNRRRVYLPRGTWTDWWSGERRTGNRWIEVEAGLETLPLYLREGAIVPLGPIMSYVDESPVQELSIRVAPFEGDGCTSFTTPVNDQQIRIEYEAKQGEHIVSIDPCNLSLQLEVLGRENVVLRKRSDSVCP